jgi:hypothetical protein
LGVPPQEKCGVGLSATIFFYFFRDLYTAQARKKNKKRIFAAIPHATNRKKKPQKTLTNIFHATL